MADGDSHERHPCATPARGSDRTAPVNDQRLCAIRDRNLRRGDSLRPTVADELSSGLFQGSTDGGQTFIGLVTNGLAARAQHPAQGPLRLTIRPRGAATIKGRNMTVTGTLTSPPCSTVLTSTGRWAALRRQAHWSPGNERSMGSTALEPRLPIEGAISDDQRAARVQTAVSPSSALGSSASSLPGSPASILGRES